MGMGLEDMYRTDEQLFHAVHLFVTSSRMMGWVMAMEDDVAHATLMHEGQLPWIRAGVAYREDCWRWHEPI